MHKLVVRVDADLRIAKDGKYLYLVDVVDIARKLSLDKASKCPLAVIGNCEIIDSSECESGDVFWWERKRVKQ
jgi:hypothetical protein